MTAEIPDKRQDAGMEIEVYGLDDLNITPAMRAQALAALASRPSRVVLVPDEPDLWEAHCRCDIWAQGGYDTEANAKRGLSQHQSRTHPGVRG